jgi:excisionase family DNA binding protein
MAKEDGKVMSANQIFDNSYWDILDLSRYLKIKVKTLYAMIYDIPHYRVGKLIRFKKEEIEAWMENKKAKDGF